MRQAATEAVWVSDHTTEKRPASVKRTTREKQLEASFRLGQSVTPIRIARAAVDTSKVTTRCSRKPSIAVEPLAQTVREKVRKREMRVRPSGRAK